MNFDKKYWSKSEFVTEDGDRFNGYVGILNGEAYVFETGEKLYGKNSYLARINTSNNNFDRILSHELKLPFAKKDVTFAANDFLYSGIIKTAIERLQANNDYIFKNAIISNSMLPATSECVLLSTLTNAEGKFDESKHSGILGKYNFSTHALSTKTQDDPAFYPQTEKAWNYFVKNTVGQTTKNVSKDTAFINNKEKERSQYLPAATPEETWHNLYGDSFDDSVITQEEVYNYRFTAEENQNKNDLPYTKYTADSLTGDYDILTINANINKNISVKSETLYNLLSSNFSESEINFSIHSLGFIIQGTPSILTSINDVPINAAVSTINKINDDFNYVTYDINKSISLTNNFTNSTKTLKLAIKFKANCKLCTYKENENIKCIMKYSIGKSVEDVNNLKLYYTIPNVSRDAQYSYCWKTTEKVGTDTVEHTHISLHTHTYKFLTESEEWLKAKADGLNPQLVMNNWGLNDTRIFVPEASMTAADVYYYMCNNVTDYDYPTIVRNVEYRLNGYTVNPEYIESIYPITSYTIEDKKIVQSFKTSENIYNELYYNNDGKQELTEEAKKYDKIPVVLREEYIKIKEGSEPIHNFNEITAADIIIRDVDKAASKCNLIILLLFKTKLLLFKTEYIFDNVSDETTPSKNNFIVNKEDFTNTNFQINFKDDSEIIVIDRINPHDESSLKFMNLNAIKVYKDMLYLVDSKLDMVLRYSIDYLVNPNEGIKNAFKKSSINLIDIMQGFGTTTDKIYFNTPYSIAVSEKHVYIVDRGNKCVKEYTPGLNFVKTLKNGFFSSHDIQAVAVNPYPCTINGIDIKKDSVWIASVLGTRMFISVLEDDIVKVYGQIEDINLLQDEYTWLEEIRGINFSETHSNYFYLNTSKRVYKFHVSQPFYPFASINYFKQRSVLGTMRWVAMKYPWDKIPSIYSIGVSGSDAAEKNDITWNYQPSQTAAEVLDNKCFCLAGNPAIEGDIIFHFGVLYNDSEVRNYIKNNKVNYANQMTFNDIDTATLATMIKSSAILLYSEPDSFITTLSNNDLKIYDTYKIEDSVDNDYISSLNINKMLYALISNLLKIKNYLIGHFRAATNIDNVIVYDNIVLDDYFNNLKLNAEEDYFVHNNEVISIIANRAFEDIHDLQEKILQKMQTEFMAAQSYVNNTSRII